MNRHDVKPSDLCISTFNTGGNWIQNQNGVRITHIPSGKTFESAESRSQHLNRNHCLNQLETFLDTWKPVNYYEAETEAIVEPKLQISGEKLKRISKAYYASTRDKSLHTIQGFEIIVQDGIVYDRCYWRGKVTKWRRCYMIPANLMKIGIEQASGSPWPLKIEYRGFELSLITDSKIVNRTGPKNGKRV